MTIKQYNNIRRRGFTPTPIIARCYIKVFGVGVKRSSKEQLVWGFTIIELITVVAIIAIVAVSSAVSFTSLIGKRLDADTRKIVSDLCWARQMAVAGHLDYIIDFNLVNDGYIIYKDVNGNGTPEVTEEVERRRLVVDLVSVTDLLPVPIVPARITFHFPNGLVQDILNNPQDSLINLSYSGRTKQIRVFADTGYVKIQ